MKVVLLHDWLTGFRGGERVLEVFCEMFPDAPLYTLVYLEGSTSKIIENRKIYSSFLNTIPFIDKHYRKALPLFPVAASSLKIKEDADLIISSSHCVIKGVKKPKGSKHFSYIHSPMRYIYDQFENYFGDNSSFLQRNVAKMIRPYLTKWDLNSNLNVDSFVANSGFVKQRIEKYYGLDSKIIHPFVELDDFNKKNIEKDDYYLMVTAFAPNKKVDLAVKAFNKNKKKLKIVGGGQQEKYLKSIALDNIEFLGQLSRQEVVDLFYRAKAFIFPGVEDFGITPLESLAAYTPIIAKKIGGVLETLNDDVAEFFIDDNVDELVKAVERFEKRKFDPVKLRDQAELFSRDKFKNEIQKEIDELMGQ